MLVDKYFVRKQYQCVFSGTIIRIITSNSMLWLATVDVGKAFGRVTHDELFAVLGQYDMDIAAVGALWRL